MVPGGVRLVPIPSPPGSDGVRLAPSPRTSRGAPSCELIGLFGAGLAGLLLVGEPGITTPIGGRAGTGADCDIDA